jgi:hypothetical protein
MQAKRKSVAWIALDFRILAGEQKSWRSTRQRWFSSRTSAPRRAVGALVTTGEGGGDHSRRADRCSCGPGTIGQTGRAPGPLRSWRRSSGIGAGGAPLRRHSSGALRDGGDRSPPPRRGRRRVSLTENAAVTHDCRSSSNETPLRSNPSSTRPSVGGERQSGRDARLRNTRKRGRLPTRVEFADRPSSRP